MKTNSDLPIPKLQDLGNGRFYYNFNHAEIERDEKTINECDTVVIEDKPTYDKIVTAVIRSSYASSKEISLINNYLSAKEGGIVEDNSDIDEYLSYQSFRKSIKEMVKTDCIELEIPID